MRLLAFVIVIAAISTTWFSPARAQSFRLLGPIDVSCGKWTTVVDIERSAYEWWALGFVSGAGYASAHNFSVDKDFRVDPAAAKEWINRYCAEHPLDPLALALIELVKELERRTTP